MRRINDGGYMKETIGNVLLNLDYYDGEDAYSDGSIEDRLLEIVKTTPKEDYQKVILTEKAGRFFIISLRNGKIFWTGMSGKTMLPYLKSEPVAEPFPACSAEMQSG